MATQPMDLCPIAVLGRLAGASSLDFLDLNDRFPLIGTAVQAGVVWQFQFVALGADGHPRRSNPELLCAPLISPGS